MNIQINRAIFVLFLTLSFFSPGLVFAHDTKVEHEHEGNESLIKQLEILKQRLLFITNAQPPMVVDKETSQYFSLKIDETSSTTVYAKKPGVLVIKTDGGVGQLMLETKCSDKGALLLNGAKKCLTQTWLTDYVEESGMRTFTIPVNYADLKATSTRKVSIYPCRFNGCHKEDTVTINYKEKREFADDLVIKDRYEWVYDWDDKTYHVQEVILGFSTKEVKKIYLDVKCETKGLYIETTEDHRVTCNQNRRFSDNFFREVKTDDEGNKYNMVIETVTNDIEPEEVGKVLLTFRFYAINNRLLKIVEYRPIQLDTLESEEDDEEEDN